MEKTVPMKEYLLKLHLINENIKDNSEFHAFLDSARRFLKADQNHLIYEKAISKAIKKRNWRIISLAFSIAAHLNSKKELFCRKIVKKYIKRSSVRDSILEYLTRFNLNFLDAEIAKMLEKDSTFVSKELYQYLKCNPRVLSRFLCIEDEAACYKQLELMINCEIFFNLPYFVRYLGHASSLICYKAFEAFYLFFQLVKVKYQTGNLEAFLSLYNLESSIELEDVTGSFHLKLGLNSILVTDPINFLNFGWSFFPEKSHILDIVISDAITTKSTLINKMLGKYVCGELNIPEASISKKNLVFASFESNIEENTPSGFLDNNFDHLFGDNYRKDICDCYEI